MTPSARADQHKDCRWLPWSRMTLKAGGRQPAATFITVDVFGEGTDSREQVKAGETYTDLGQGRGSWMAFFDLV